MFAVIKTGGKQYIVEPKQKLKVELLPNKEGEKFSFKEVLLVHKNKKLHIGTPQVKGASVEAKLLQNGRAKKITIFRSHPKTRYRKKKGHRQPFSEVEILKINV